MSEKNGIWVAHVHKAQRECRRVACSAHSRVWYAQRIAACGMLSALRLYTRGARLRTKHDQAHGALMIKPDELNQRPEFDSSEAYDHAPSLVETSDSFKRILFSAIITSPRG